MLLKLIESSEILAYDACSCLSRRQAARCPVWKSISSPVLNSIVSASIPATGASSCGRYCLYPIRFRKVGIEMPDRYLHVCHIHHFSLNLFNTFGWLNNAVYSSQEHTGCRIHLYARGQPFLRLLKHSRDVDIFHAQPHVWRQFMTVIELMLSS